MNIKNLPDLDQRVIKSLKEHLSTGYEKSNEAVQAVIDAIQLGKIRLTRQADIHGGFEELAGDCFNPAANPSVPAEKLKREAENFRRKIRRTGVWAMISEYWTGREWKRFDNITDNIIGGFVGHDFFGSGYELQVMEAALEAYNQQDLDAEGFVIDPFRKAA